MKLYRDICLYNVIQSLGKFDNFPNIFTQAARNSGASGLLYVKTPKVRTVPGVRFIVNILLNGILDSILTRRFYVLG